MSTQMTDRDRTLDGGKSRTLTWVLLALAVLALLLLIAFGLDRIAVDSAGGDIDVETPDTDVQVDGPDLDVDVDGELEGDAEADAEAPQ